MKKTRHIGIDEVGRGPLAGPVTVCAFVVVKDFDMKLLKGITDSKKLTEKVREEWNIKLRELQKKRKVNFSVSSVGAKIIDKKGISFAIRTALSRSLRKLNVDPKNSKVFLDGGLRAPEEYVNQETIIKGDSKNKCISSASVLAKVYRDAYMRKVAKRFPAYGFEVHKGYGTLRHRNSIKKYGPCELHRRSFIKRVL